MMIVANVVSRARALMHLVLSLSSSFLMQIFLLTRAIRQRRQNATQQVAGWLAYTTNVTSTANRAKAELRGPRLGVLVFAAGMPWRRAARDCKWLTALTAR